MGPSSWPRVVAVIAVSMLLGGCSGQGGVQQFYSQFSQPCGPKLVYWQPVWSPDGQRLAFYSDYGESRLYVMNTGGRVEALLNVDNGGGIDHPAWSPDGERLAIAMQHRLAVVKRDGSGLVQLVDPASDETDSLPAWSPDGQQILFVSLDQQKHTAINLVNADGSGRKQIALSYTSTWVWPSWSPDGTRILFKLVDEAGMESVAVINRDGSGLKNVGPPSKYYHGAAWSPDGKRIAYSYGAQADDSRIFLMDADGTNVDLLTLVNVSGAAGPEWSPDGKQIAFSVTSTRRQPTLFVASIDGKTHAELSLGFAGGFSWSPDSKQIANSGDFSSDVYLMDPDGSNVRQLTQNPAKRTCFAWPF